MLNYRKSFTVLTKADAHSHLSRHAHPQRVTASATVESASFQRWGRGGGGASHSTKREASQRVGATADERFVLLGLLRR